ncbi:MAG: 7-cyano-7-deazaguanine synthase QueC [Sphingomonadaceae bacterium]
MSTKAPPAVVLLSGGLDSCVAAAWARAQGFALEALSLDYGQRHRVELEAAQRVAEALGVRRHVMLALDLAAFGGSALTDTALAVPKAGVGPGIPVTYVPARNTIMLALALAMAETAGARDIVLGINAIDYSGYPDCRPEFLDTFAQVARLGTKAGVEGAAMHLHAPLQQLGKADIVRLGVKLGAPLALTWSCYDPGADGRPCGLCDSCRLRAAGFAEAGLSDPALAEA